MRDIFKACQSLEENGKARKVSDNVYFIGKIAPDKLANLERSYADGFHKRLTQRRAEERKAEQKFHDFIITY